jgi:hypothetical protein
MAEQMHLEHAIRSKTRSTGVTNEISSTHVHDFNVLLELDLLRVPFITLIAVEVGSFRDMQSLVVPKAVHRFESFVANLRSKKVF